MKKGTFHFLTKNLIKCSLVLLMFFVYFQSNAQIDSTLLSIKSSSSGSISVCGDSIVFTIKVFNRTSSDSTFNSVYVQTKMPIGMEYESGSEVGATFVNSNVLMYPIRTIDGPIFALTDIASGDTITFSYRAKANCTIIPFLKNSSAHQPVGIVNNNRVYYRYGSLRRTNTEPNGSESYNALFAELQLLVNAGDVERDAFIGDVIKRKFSITNSGLGFVKDVVAGGNGIKIEIQNDGNLQFNSAKLLSSGLNITPSIAGTTITLNITDFSSIGNHDHKLDENEKIEIEETVKVLNCVSNITSNYATTWGCNANICNLGEANSKAPAFVNVYIGNPKVDVTMQQMPTSDLCGVHPDAIFKLTNNSTGSLPALANAAIGVTLYLNSGILGALSIKDSTGNYTSFASLGIVPSLSRYSLDNASGLYQKDIDGQGTGLTDLDGDKYYDDLPVGQSFYVKAINNLTNCPGNSFYWDIDALVYCKNTCGTTFESRPYVYAVVSKERWFTTQLSTGPSTVTGPADLTDGISQDFTLTTNNTFRNEGILNCNTGTFISYITIPKIYTVNSIKWSGSTVSYTKLNDSLYQVNNGGFAGSYVVNLTLICGQSNTPGSGTITWNMFYQCGSCSTCMPQLVNNAKYTFLNHCLNCPGFHTTSFVAQRTTLGKIPAADGEYTWGEFKSAPKVSPSDPGLRLDAGFQYDTLQAIAKGILTAGTYGEAHVQVKYTSPISGNPFTYLGAKAIINNGSACTLGSPVVKQIGSTWYYDFTIPNTCKGGASFVANDKIDLYADFKINATNALSRGEYRLTNFRANHYGVIAGDTNSCESFGTNFTIAKIDVQAFSYVSGYDCNGYTAAVITDHFPAIQGQDVVFPNEFRPVSHIEHVEVVLPAGFVYKPGTSDYLVRHPYTAIPIGDPVISTVGGNQKLVFDINDSWGINDMFRTLVITDWLRFAIVPVCDSIQFTQFGVNFIYTLNDYTYNPSLIQHVNATSYNMLTGTSMNARLSLAPNAMQEGYSKDITWPVQICNSTGTTATYPWVSFVPPGLPNQANIELVSAFDVTANKTLTLTNSVPSNSDIKLVKIDDIGAFQCKTINLTANYTNCIENKVDTVGLFGGWGCAYPSSTADFACKTRMRSKLFIRYKTAQLQASFQKSETGFQLCAPVPFSVNLTSSGYADLDNLEFWIQTPNGVTFNTGSGQYAFPSTSTTFGTLPVATTTGTGIGWSLSAINPTQTVVHPFKGSRAPGQNSIKLNFTVTADCNYDPGMPVKFFTRAISNCGVLLERPFSQYKIKLQGVDIDTLQLALTAGNFSSCGSPVNVRLTATNRGTAASKSGQWEVTLPKGIAIVPTSGVPSPSTTTLNSDSSTTLRWPMAGGIAPGRSGIFNFVAALNRYNYDSDSAMITARTIIPVSAICATTGQTCQLRATTGADTVKVAVDASLPTITLHPDLDTLCYGKTVLISFTSNIPITGYGGYQWYLNGTPTVIGSTYPYIVQQGLATIRLELSKGNLCKLTATKNVLGLDVPDIIHISHVKKIKCYGDTDGNVEFTIAGSAVPVTSIVLTGPGHEAGTPVALTTTKIDSLGLGDYQFIISYANGCVRNTNFTVAYGGPVVSLCVKNIPCGDPGTSNLEGKLFVSREVPSPSGTYHYLVYKMPGQHLLINSYAAFGADVPLSLGSALIGDQFYVELVPDTNPGGNTCHVISSRDELRSPMVDMEGDSLIQLCGTKDKIDYEFKTKAFIACSDEKPLVSYELYRRDVNSTAAYTLIDQFTAAAGKYKLTGIGAGEYLIKAIFDPTNFNCAGSLKFKVKPPDIDFLTKTEKRDQKCPGVNDGYIIANVYGGLLPISYSWYELGNTTGIGSGSRIDSLSPGTYVLIVKDASECEHYIPDTITIDSAPNMPDPVLTAQGCTIEASIAVGQVAPYTMEWIYYREQTDGSLVPETFFSDAHLVLNGSNYHSVPSSYGVSTPKGLYKVIATSSRGCNSWDTLTLESPLPHRNYELCLRYRTTSDTVSKPKPPKVTITLTGPAIAASGMITALQNQMAECKTATEEAVKEQFKASCLDLNHLHDEVTLNYNIHYQHYMLYYFDRANRLVRTVPPKGVDMSATSRVPAPLRHTFVTEYDFNSYAQMERQKTPDAGETQFIYNETGQLRFSQNARQVQDGVFSYTKYDSLGRIVEVGESKLTSTFASLATQLSGENSLTITNRYPVSSDPDNKEQTFTLYSEPVASVDYFGKTGQRYVQNRVSHTWTINKNGDTSRTYFSYDPHGNVNWLAQDLQGFGRNYVAYDYDLISNKVLKVKYNEYRKDRFFHRYAFDEDNRLTLAETSKDNIIWDKDANYNYYVHGPLRRTGLGEDKVQGLDYTYTIQGWLKGINSPNLIASEDPGRDTLNGYAPDLFGMTLGYYEGDFTRPGVFNSKPGGKYYLATTRNLYNGNISTWTSKIGGHASVEAYNKNLTGETYAYDRLNRIKTSNFNVFNGSSYTAQSNYATTYSYDGNGNILNLSRTANTGTAKMDELEYEYYGSGVSATNKLKRVKDNSTASINGTMNDIKSGQADSNYVYDAIGNLIRDNQEKLSFTWNVYGKITQVIPDKVISGTQKPSIKFTYDAAGNRISKEVNEQPVYSATGAFIDSIADLSKLKTTYYVRDASGNVMAIYERENAFAFDSVVVTCDSSMVDTAMSAGTRYCYTGSIPTVNLDCSKYTALSASHTAIAAGDTLCIPVGSTYAGNFTLDSAGVLIVCGDYTPSWYTFNKGKIIVTSTGKLTFPWITLNAGQRIDNYGTLSLSNPSIGGVLNNYGTLNVTGNLNFYNTSTFINYGTVNAGSGIEGNKSHFTNFGTINVTGNFSNNGGQVINKGPLTVSQNVVNNTGNFKNECTIVAGANFEVNAPFINLGKIISQTTSTINGGGYLYLQGGSTLITGNLAVYNVVQNDSTGKCSLLKVAGTITKGSGANFVGNINVCNTSGTGNSSTGGCSAPQWNATTVYTKDQEVQFNGVRYIAWFWTQGNQPDVSNGSGQPWISLGTCGGSTSTGGGTGTSSGCTAVTWNATIAYVGNDSVQFNGTLYRAQWWTQGNQPDLNSGGGLPWINLGACGTGSTSGTSSSGTVNDTTIASCNCMPREPLCTSDTVQIYRASYKLIEVPIYGSDRLGNYAPLNHVVSTALFKVDENEKAEIMDSTIYNIKDSLYFRTLTEKVYELKDHLGNVRVVITDEKKAFLAGGGVPVGLTANLRSYSNYYAFGMEQPGRQHVSSFGAHSVGFNGMRKDNEIYGEGNAYDFGARMYDSRLGRWLTTDPEMKLYPEASPYGFALNSPIQAIDPDGNVVIFINGLWGSAGGIKSPNEGYWGTQWIANLKNHWRDQNSMFFDGSVGGQSNLAFNRSAEYRIAQGRNAGFANAKTIIDNLSGDETIKFVTNSMGAAFQRGFSTGIQDYIIQRKREIFWEQSDVMQKIASIGEQMSAMKDKSGESYQNLQNQRNDLESKQFDLENEYLKLNNVKTELVVDIDPQNKTSKDPYAEKHSYILSDKSNYNVFEKNCLDIQPVDGATDASTKSDGTPVQTGHHSSWVKPSDLPK